PSLLGNLWDVTDKDIDRFSMSVLDSCGLGQERLKPGHAPLSLLKAVSVSREACTLKYLIGASPVVYGIPCAFQCPSP
ncbi:hypothetical protein BJ684DRAFT_12737, partial [Piptocephalis cylindrospora]